MGRRERPLDEDGGAVTRFAAELRRLRVDAGTPTFRELARRAHYAAGTLSEATGGKKLPTLAVTTAFVRACGGDERAWEARWRAASAALAAERD
ncbi:helix-turn-helix domain-containing protein [Amycolatopsis sp. CA-230715]|uniref:helix-turn-helix domain-containing protein n=1 Tax=Amycolatopsis sp. CA-230715 TaxID=2745196 RepID=UPI001C0281B9|nr:helix-turn-helix domain-containing protein [Amycolatopsis sp. CA-230715]QWF76687.1 hypothetical protein HUW46_00063 [Amycolatopsis sp. CA-230715]